MIINNNKAHSSKLFSIRVNETLIIKYVLKERTFAALIKW